MTSPRQDSSNPATCYAESEAVALAPVRPVIMAILLALLLLRLEGGFLLSGSQTTTKARR